MNLNSSVVNWNSAKIIKSEQIGLLPGKNLAQKNSNDIFLYIPYGRDTPAHPIRIPYAWNENVFDDRNWFAQLHMMRMLDSNILAYESEGDSKYMDFPCSIFEDWFVFYQNMEKMELPSLVWSDMIVGIRALRLAYCISYLIHSEKTLGSSFDKTVYEELVRLHLEFLLDVDNYRFNNHSIHDIHGLMGLAQIVDNECRSKIVAFVKKNMPAIILSQFNQQGMHLENSPEYHNYGMMLFDKLHKTGWFTEFDLETFLQKAGKFQDWFVLPDGRLLPFGDTTRKKAPRRTESFNFKADTNVLNNSGYVIIRELQKNKVQDSSYFAFMGACNSKTHKHSDDLSIFWFEGEEILSDMGKYAYQNCDYRRHALSTRAHNTIEINEEDYYHGTSIASDQIFGSAIESVGVTDFGYHIKSSIHRKKLAKTRNLNITHERDVLYSMGRFLVVLDRITSKDDLRFTNWLNFAPGIDILENITLNEMDCNYILGLNSKRNLYVTSKIINNNEYEVYQGKGIDKPRTIGWNSDKYNNAIPSLAIGISTMGTAITFLNILSMDEQSVDVDLKNNSLILKDAVNENNYIVDI